MTVRVETHEYTNVLVEATALNSSVTIDFNIANRIKKHSLTGEYLFSIRETANLFSGEGLNSRTLRDIADYLDEKNET